MYDDCSTISTTKISLIRPETFKTGVSCSARALSTGGGAYMRETNRRMITERGVAVWLDAELPVLWNRVKHKNTRPLLQTSDPRGTLREIYEQRVPVYALSDLKVPSEQGKSIEAMAGRVIEVLKTRPDVLQEDE